MRMDSRRKRSLSIVLAGIDGFYNYGCEAIVRGTVQMLREKWPDCHIEVASGYVDNDRTVLQDLERVSVIPMYQRVTWRRVGKGILRRIGIGTGSSMPLHHRLRKGYDLSLSVGGDNYSLTADNRGISPLVSELMRWGEKCLDNGGKHVLWGASVGPFEACPEARERMVVHLKRLSLITARDPKTYTYLHELGCRQNTVLVADPAFVMEPSTDVPMLHRKPGHLRMAINLSELSLRHLFSRDDKGYDTCKAMLTESIRRLAQMPSVQILLVPHVTGYGCLFDDREFMNSLVQDIPGEVQALPSGLGATRTKAILQGCDLVIAARMHCAIAAVSAGVPTLFLSYSVKGPGMSEYVYGSDEFALWLDRLTPQRLCEKVKDMRERQAELSNQLKKSQAKWQSDARKAVTALDRLWS
jgi:colanic acid/amylovoran biosynthesis protein